MPSLRESRIIYRVCQSIEVRCGGSCMDCFAGTASLAMTDLLKLKMSQSINRLLCLACDLRGNLGKILACTGVDDGA